MTNCQLLFYSPLFRADCVQGGRPRPPPRRCANSHFTPFLFSRFSCLNIFLFFRAGSVSEHPRLPNYSLKKNGEERNRKRRINPKPSASRNGHNQIPSRVPPLSPPKVAPTASRHTHDRPTISRPMACSTSNSSSSTHVSLLRVCVHVYKKKKCDIPPPSSQPFKKKSPKTPTSH